MKNDLKKREQSDYIFTADSALSETCARASVSLISPFLTESCVAIMNSKTSIISGFFAMLGSDILL